MKITKKWLEKRNACKPSLEHVCNNNYIGLDIVLFLEKLMKEGRLSDAIWLITRYMNKRQNVLYAIFAAEQVLPIFEEKYPNDDRPRKAIEAAKDYVKRPCKKTIHAAAAAHAAYAAAAAHAADADAVSAIAAHAAVHAADAAGEEIRMKIINKGLDILNSAC